MSRIPCNVIKDLMVLYEDDVCSEESRQMVKEHIEECEECRKLFLMTKEKLPDISLGENGEEVRNSIDELKEVSRRTCKKLERKITYRHILIVSLALVAAILVSSVWTEWLKYEVNVVPKEDVEITELYELESGDIYCTFKCKENFMYVNPSRLRVPEGMGFQDCDDGWQEIYFQYSRPFGERPVIEVVSNNQISVVFSRVDTYGMINEDGEWTAPDGYTHKCAAIYYGRTDKEDTLLVWKEGQEIKPAPKEIENRVRRNGIMLGQGNYYGNIIMLVR